MNTEKSTEVNIGGMRVCLETYKQHTLALIIEAPQQKSNQNNPPPNTVFHKTGGDSSPMSISPQSPRQQGQHIFDDDLYLRTHQSMQLREKLVPYLNNATLQKMEENLQPFMPKKVGAPMPVFDPTKNNSTNILQLHESLGKGRYGTVWRGSVKNSQIAIKRGTIDDSTTWEGAIKEINIMQKTSAMVESGTNPHFCLFSGAIIQRKRTKQVSTITTTNKPSTVDGKGNQQLAGQKRKRSNSGEGSDAHKKKGSKRMRYVYEDYNHYFAFLELAAGDLDSWWRHSSGSDASYLGMVLQILMGIIKMGKDHDIIHNDLYFRNILFRNIPTDTVHTYHIGNVEFEVKTEGHLFMLGDFGLATSDKLKIGALECDHKSAIIGEYQKKKSSGSGSSDCEERKVYSIAETMAMGFSKHVMFSALPPYSRDLVALVSRLAAEPSMGRRAGGHSLAVRTWITKFLNVLRGYLQWQPKLLDQVAGVEAVVVEMFGSPTLRSCGLDPSLFQTVPPREPLHHHHHGHHYHFTI